MVELVPFDVYGMEELNQKIGDIVTAGTYGIEQDYSAATQEKAAKLAKLALAFELKQAQEGAEKLFGSITATEIAAALNEKGFEVERRDVVVAKAINHVGEHDVTVDLGYSVKVQIKVKVTGNTDENFEKPVKSRRPRKSATTESTEEKA
jgi:ribosomal protein L9